MSLPLSQQIDFIRELDKLKAVRRQIRLPQDENRRENSAEHSWQVALAASILSGYAAEPVDIARVTTMILIHDLVEIDAGDLFAFAEAQHHEAQELKELAAAKRIFGLLPEQQGQQYLELWLEFEAAQTNDARFAKSMDRVLPVFQNMANEGGSWKQHGVKQGQILKRNEYLKESAPALWTYVTEQVELAVKQGWLLP